MVVVIAARVVRGAAVVEELELVWVAQPASRPVAARSGRALRIS
jgi:hypothetical protein